MSYTQKADEEKFQRAQQTEDACAPRPRRPPARPAALRPRGAPRTQAAAPRRPPTELELEDIDSFCWAWAEVEPQCVGTIAGKEEVAKVIEGTRCPPARPPARPPALRVARPLTHPGRH